MASRRPSAAQTGAMAVAGLAASSAFASTVLIGEHPVTDVIWRLTVLVGGVVAAALARRRNGIHRVFAAMVVLAAVRMASIDNRDLAFSVRDATWSQALADVVAGPVLLLTLVMMLRIRRGSIGRRELLDGVSVLSAASMVAWITVANPAWEAGTPLPLAVAAAMGVPIAFMFVSVTLELLLDGLVRNRAMWLLFVATIVNLAASVARAFIDPGDSTAHTLMRLVVVTYAAAFLLGCASMCHPHAPAIVRRHHDSTVYPRREVLRLAPFAIAIAMVGYPRAAVLPPSPTDKPSPAVMVVAMIVAVLARLHSALSASFAAQIKLRERLLTDDLTALPNRNMLVQLLATQLDEQWRTGVRATVVHVSIDRFKQLNDALGHATANRLLIGVAGRLGDLADELGVTATRSGGDEFVLLAGIEHGQDDPSALVDRVVDALARPFSVDGTPIFITASIGVATAPSQGLVEADELIQHATIATHRAKTAGRNRVVQFDESMQAHLADRMEVEHALHGALGRRELLLFHQPIVDIADGRLTGFEALIRWRRSDGSLVSPAEFIPIAEETGIINEIGAWALREALSHLATWIRDGIVGPNTTMSVNVSPRQITDPRFADTVAEALDITGVAPHQLWLEMTESMMLQEPELALLTLRRIRTAGVRLALDDFGTGYSSLSMLQRFPIQRIKIDRAFVQGLADSTNDRSLVRTIIAMAQSLGLDLVAEGVETMGQLRSLRELGCERAQGFLISRPVPAEAIRSTVDAIADAAFADAVGERETSGATSRHTPSTGELVRPSVGPIGGLLVTPLR